MMKLLVAYDKNITTSAVLTKALEFAKKFNAHVYFLRTCSSTRDVQEIQIMENRLNELGKDVFKKAGLTYETHVMVRGLAPGEDIVQFARDNEIDQIIIGIKKRSKIGKMMFGSTAQFIILEAHCPVLCVK